MFFSWILKKFKDRREKQLLIQEMILSMRLEETQKNLFLDSLELLDEKSLHLFYERIIQFVDREETILIHQKYQDSKRTLSSIWRKEEKERMNSGFNILLDNI